LLNSLDGVAAAEGRYVRQLLCAHRLMTVLILRLLFATTNHIERLDPALSRPGRMDVWINFTHATKWQAEGIFKCFFPHAPSSSDDSSSPSESTASPLPASPTDAAPTDASMPTDASQQNLPLPKRSSTHAVPLLTEVEIAELAKRFAEAIPEDELSVASLQGYLLKNKTRPRQCVDEVADWVIQERETREKLKKEKAEVRIRTVEILSEKLTLFAARGTGEEGCGRKGQESCTFLVNIVTTTLLMFLLQQEAKEVQLFSF
jgi:chaperone BCS1